MSVSADEKAAPPSPAQIREARQKAGLTPAEAGSLVHTYARLWRYWESGKHRMPPGLWELFQIKVAQLAEGQA